MNVNNGLPTRRERKLFSLVSVCMLLDATSAWGQQGIVPSTLNPAFLQRNVEPPPEVDLRSKITLPSTESATAPADADAITFVFGGVRIEGATAIRSSELLALWPHKPGDTANVAEIFQFANAITEAYREAGYTLSFALVPAQDIENGIFTIRVVEGYVERIVVEGVAQERVRAMIERVAAPVTTMRPLRTAALERMLLLVNDIPGVTVSGVLSPAESQGGAKLSLNTHYKPVAGSIGYNNFMPSSLGEHLVEGAVETRGLFNGSDHARLWIQHSLGSRAYWSVASDISTAAGTNGMRIGISGFHSKSDPDDELLDVLEYTGTSTHGRVYAEYPIMRSRERNIYLGGSFEINNTSSDLLAQTFFEDSLRSVSAWLAYDFVDATRASTTIKGTINQGLDILSAGGSSRADGQLDYTTLQLDAKRSQPVAPLAGGSFALELSGFGQAAIGGGGLFSPAECSFGGRRFGRAFDAGIIAGDSCIMGSFALHWLREVELANTSASAALDLYGFVDGGLAWQTGTLQPGEARRSSASSAGIGMKMQVSETTSGFVEVSRQLSQSSGEIDSGPRVLGTVTFRF